MDSFLVARGHRLEYQLLRPTRDRRSEGGMRPVLVFLHEGLGSVAMWKNFPQAVADATGCDALVYSRHGHGQSDRLTEARAVDYMHHEALDVLPEVLTALRIEAPLFIGHSDGASIALIHTGAGGPARGMVLMAPHVFVEDITVASIAQAKVNFATTDLRDKLGRYHRHPESTFQGWNDVWLLPEFRSWNIEHYLPKITAPVLLIQGEEDAYGTLSQIETIARQVKGPVETLVLTHCGHAPHVDRRDATENAIVRFVERCSYCCWSSP